MFAVMSNLSLLIWFKYAVFIEQNFNAFFMTNTKFQLWVRELALPLGISLYTFPQIRFLTDLYQITNVARELTISQPPTESEKRP